MLWPTGLGKKNRKRKEFGPSNPEQANKLRIVVKCFYPTTINIRVKLALLGYWVNLQPPVVTNLFNLVIIWYSSSPLPQMIDTRQYYQ